MIQPLGCLGPGDRLGLQPKLGRCRIAGSVIRNGSIAHQMPAMFKDAGLQDVEAAPIGAVFTDFELADLPG